VESRCLAAVTNAFGLQCTRRLLQVYVLTRKELAQFFKRVFSPQALFEPLPPALRLTLTRNFSFFTRIFTRACPRVQLRR
jgi:hypothetical protein